MKIKGYQLQAKFTDRPEIISVPNVGKIFSATIEKGVVTLWATEEYGGTRHFIIVQSGYNMRGIECQSWTWDYIDTVSELVDETMTRRAGLEVYLVFEVQGIVT